MPPVNVEAVSVMDIRTNTTNENAVIVNQRIALDNTHAFPNNVGILAMEMYVPKTFVSQTALEKYDEISAGKYTVGLGQTNMAFCGDNEDIHSICLNAVKNLMKKYNIAPTDIGRIEVGTETIVDKSKSCKSVLMQLFIESGNTDIEGIDTTNACYGGTNALINTIAWIESSYWDGRYGLVVAGDIAVYGNKSARPTGGAGVVAMLIGPDAPISFERGLRTTHMEHVYDFYKPDLTCEYPTVDGKLSNSCYLRAIDQCYTRYAQKFQKKTSTVFDLTKADYLAFHTPYVKLVQKSVARLCFLEFLGNPDREDFQKPEFQQYRNTKPEDTYFNADLEKVFRKIGDSIFEKKATPATMIATNVGNSYCASVYAALLSLISTAPQDQLLGKRILFFSYGSGLAASMFSAIITKPVLEIAQKANIVEKLKQRVEVSPEQYVEVMQLREKACGQKNYTPVSSIDNIEKGDYYLKYINEQYQRFYEIKV